MKITEIKCTACNGEIKIDPNDPNTAVCEYCKTKYVIEYEGNDQVHMRGRDSDSWYTPREPVVVSDTTNWESYRRVRTVLLVVCGIVGLLLFSWNVTNARGLQNRQQKEAAAMVTKGIEKPTAEYPVAEKVSQEPFTGLLQEFVETLYGKPQEEITEGELAAVKWLEIRTNIDGGIISYSFDSPYENQEAELTVMTLTQKEVSTLQICRFSGLEKLYMPSTLTSQFKQLNLKGISCRVDSLAELAQNLANPDGLEELEIRSDIKSLKGIGAFSSLRTFSIDTDEAIDLTPLAQLKKLTSFSLEGDQITDYSVLSTMQELTSLAITSEGLKDVGFVSSMPKLTNLEVKDAAFIHLNGLNGLTNLTSLSVDNCMDVQDLSSIEVMSNLESLWLEVPYGCTEPDLTGLNKLKTLYIRNMSQLNFLAFMPQLEVLTLSGCEITNPDVFAGLVQLKELKCSYLFGDLRGWLFAVKLPALEVLDLTAVTTYEDISALFGIGTLHTLILNGVECEIRFDKLKPNDSLKVLEMRGIMLYTNVDIQGGGGIYSINYDKVNLDDHTDFLGNYQNLEQLNLSENKLTQLNVAAGLKRLSKVNISDNYITDLKPFTSLQELQWMNTMGNPIENYLLVPERVMVIK